MQNTLIIITFITDFRSANGALIKVKYKLGSSYKDVWNSRDLKILEVVEGMAELRLKIGPNAVTSTGNMDYK